MFHFPGQGQSPGTLNSWWSPVTGENSSALRHISLGCLRCGRYVRRAQWRPGAKVCPSVCGLKGPDAHSVWTRCFQSFPSHAGEKTTTSSARGGTAASGWKRALSVVFWWSPSPLRNALSLVFQSGGEHKHGAARGSKHTPACKP